MEISVRLGNQQRWGSTLKYLHTRIGGVKYKAIHATSEETYKGGNLLAGMPVFNTIRGFHLSQ